MAFGGAPSSCKYVGAAAALASTTVTGAATVTSLVAGMNTTAIAGFSVAAQKPPVALSATTARRFPGAPLKPGRAATHHSAVERFIAITTPSAPCTPSGVVALGLRVQFSSIVNVTRAPSALSANFPCAASAPMHSERATAPPPAPLKFVKGPMGRELTNTPVGLN